MPPQTVLKSCLCNQIKVCGEWHSQHMENIQKSIILNAHISVSNLKLSEKNCILIMNHNSFKLGFNVSTVSVHALSVFHSLWRALGIYVHWQTVYHMVFKFKVKIQRLSISVREIFWAQSMWWKSEEMWYKPITPLQLMLNTVSFPVNWSTAWDQSEHWWAGAGNMLWLGNGTNVPCSAYPASQMNDDEAMGRDVGGVHSSGA